MDNTPINRSKHLTDVFRLLKGFWLEIGTKKLSPGLITETDLGKWGEYVSSRRTSLDDMQVILAALKRDHSCLDEAWMKTQQCVDVILECFELHGCRALLGSCSLRLACLIWQYFVLGRASTYLKWKLPCLFSTITGQDFPKRPDFTPPDERPGILLGGGFYVFSKIQRTNFNSSNLEKRRRAFSFANSFLQGVKRSMPALDVSVLEKEVGDSAVTLTTQQTVDERLVVLSDQVRRTVEEVFRRAQMPEVTFSAPSRRGHFGQSRKKLGASIPVFDQKPTASTSSCFCWIGDIEGLSFERRCNVCSVGKNELWRRWYEQVRLHSAVEEPSAELVGLLEPLKIRTISKGPSLAYFLMRPFQSWMWRAVARIPCFKFTAEVTGDSLLQELGLLRDGNSWLSGDFKSASNLISPVLTEVAWKTMSKMFQFPSDIEEVGLNCLTRHVVYQRQGKVSVRIGPQRHGQLMGSPLSFPILCLVNAAIARFVEEEDTGEVIPLRKWKALVNGDDLLMQCSPRAYEFWKEWTYLGGLQMSVGKNYYSDKFANINSTPYLYTPHWWLDHDPFSRIPFVNSALLRGWVAKGVVGVGKLELEPSNQWGLASRANDLLKGFNLVDRDRIMQRFLLHHKELLSCLPPGMSYWLPRSLGGLGLPRTRAVENESRDGMRVASHLFRELKSGLPIAQLPIVGSSDDPILNVLTAFSDATVVAMDGVGVSLSQYLSTQIFDLDSALLGLISKTAEVKKEASPFRAVRRRWNKLLKESPYCRHVPRWRLDLFNEEQLTVLEPLPPTPCFTLEKRIQSPPKIQVPDGWNGGVILD